MKRVVTLVFLAAVAVPVLGAFHAHCQGLNLQPSAKDLGAAVGRTSVRTREALGEAGNESYPVFVFIPGILGSKLTKTLKHGARKPIWGEQRSIFARPDPDFAYDENDIVSAEVLQEFNIGGSNRNVYGRAIQLMRDQDFRGRPDSVLLFAYDWRQSNERSADRLNQWVCEQHPKLVGRPVIFVAHSMGGLVLKRWLQKHFLAGSACGTDVLARTMNVERIVFLGTPHLGAPKAIAAFADKLYLFADPNNSSFVTRWVDARTMALGINEFGATFPSGYQLLPVTNSTACVKRHRSESPIWVTVGSERHDRIDLFEPETWRRLGWPKSLNQGIDREKFLRDTLPKLLTEAHAFICNIREFEVDKHFTVTRFYGNRYPTPCEVIVSPQSPGTSTIRPRNCGVRGDGTVPKWSAEESEELERDSLHASKAEHSTIPESEEFINFVGNIYNAVRARTVVRALEKADRAEIVGLFASLKSPILVPSDPGLAEDSLSKNDAEIRDLNRDILASIGLSLRELRGGGGFPAGSRRRADVLSLYASLAEENDPARAFALNQAANIHLARGDFGSARALGEQSLRLSEALPDKVAIQARRGAGLVAGLAAARQGMTREAKAYLSRAADSGSSVARKQMLALGLFERGSVPGNDGRPSIASIPASGPGPLPSGMPPLNETRFASNEVVMQLGGDLSSEQVAGLTRQYGLEVISRQAVSLLGRTVYRFRITGRLSVRDAIAGLQSRGATISAQPSYQFELAEAVAPTETTRQGDSAQYIVTKLGLVEAHGIATGKNVKVAVIDSAIDGQHPDLQGVITASYDALPSNDLTPHPHGTGMAGAIGSHQRLLGVAPSARILGIRAFGLSDSGAQGTSMNIVKGLEWAIAQGAQIINFSFAGPRDPLIEQAIRGLKDKGIVLIAAAGNAGPNSPPLFPAADPNVIAVSATDVDDKTYKNASRGRQVAIAAPGVDILVPAPAGGYQLTTGTSVAAAHVSGVVALMLERNPRLTPNDVRNILAATAKKLPSDRNEVGAGLVDPVQALIRSAPRSIP
jgi:hypothetical protein